MSLFRSNKAFPSISWEKQKKKLVSARNWWPDKVISSGCETQRLTNLHVSWRRLHGGREPGGPHPWWTRQHLPQTRWMGPYWVEPWTPGTLTVHYNLKRENKGKKRALFLYLRGINIDFVFAWFPTCPVALRERIWAGRRLSAHAHGGRAVGELLWRAKAVGGLWRIGRANGAESRIAGIHGVAFAVGLV